MSALKKQAHKGLALFKTQRFRYLMQTSNKAVPGERGLPFLGNILSFIKDCNALQSKMVQRYGVVYYNYMLAQRVVYLMSPEGNEFVLLDRDNNFSSRKAWNMSLGKLFPNGLMLRDGDEHRWHRRMLGAPFKSNALSHYVAKMNPDIANIVQRWGDAESILFYPAVKELTLSLASRIFIGETNHAEINKLNQAFVDVVDASVVVVRYPMFGNKFQRGLEGRAYLENYFRSRIANKKASNDSDMFAEICRAEGDTEGSFSEQDIVDHIIFLMMAAHDTTTSSLSSICYALGKNSKWQQRIREQINLIADDELSFDKMAEFDMAGLVLNESLRLYPPLPIIPRALIKDCEFQGFQLKKGDHVVVSPTFTQRMPGIWSNPDEFDPERFSKDRAEDRKHRHAWVPFGGGVHKCLGLKFAELQIKLVLFHLLKRYQIEIDKDYRMPYQPAPIGKPKDLLPLKLRRI